MVQESQHLPSALARQAHLSLQAAHRDPEVQQNQQPRLGHFHHENRDCHGSQEGQLNLEGQVHPRKQMLDGYCPKREQNIMQLEDPEHEEQGRQGRER